MRTVVLREFIYAVGSATLPSTHAVTDRTISYDDAERLLKCRLYRRKNYGIIHGQLCEILTSTSSCSNCDEGPEYGGNGVQGYGCSECGYTGRRRSLSFFPVEMDDRMGQAVPMPLASWEKIDGSPVHESERRWFPQQPLIPCTALVPCAN